MFLTVLLTYYGPYYTSFKENGHPFIINKAERIFRGTIAYASGDTPGSQLLGGFKEGCNAHCKCRQCLGNDEEVKSKVFK